MIRKSSFLLFLLTALALPGFAQVEEGNVWLLDEQGVKHFTCPVKGDEAVVGEDTEYSDYNNKRYYFCCPGCKPDFDADPEKYLKKLTIPGNAVKMKGKKINFICPVTGESGTVAKNTKFSDYQGKRYYLCCAGCKPKFEKDPEKYIQSMKGSKQ